MIVNPNAKVRVEIVFGEMPVLFVEDFYADPEVVRGEALRSEYDLSIAYYPGRHATIQTPAANTVIAHLCRLLNVVGDATYGPETFFTDFSIVTTRVRDLLAGQKHPHIDPTPILGLVYLNPVDPVGTSFYENTVLGLRSIRTAEDAKRHAAFMAQDAKRYEPESYDLSNSPCWRKYYTIEGRFNRLVVYPGNFFHAVDIRSIPDELKIEEARLTQRFICQAIASKEESRDHSSPGEGR